MLGGTTEGRLLAGELSADHDVTVSLAGRVRSPLPLPGTVRVGGFGGVDGLAAWLREHRTDAVVDATHPFAATMTAHAAAACGRVGVPFLRLQRPGWTAVPGDDWRSVPDLPAAARVAAALGERIFLSTGRSELAVFAPVDRWFLVRSVDPPEPPVPARMRVLLDRGPFTLDGERALLREHAVDVLVTKDSGGPAAKLAAARELGVPVVVVARPPLPPGVPAVATVAAAAGWVSRGGGAG
ncbi:cobalt-precorrin-6A reductase [Pseudonocardia sp. S2-4]|uniref:Cobalt-precorrin-6A reductase n=1 Tax=Pseudonocardia humida TaxID=2800819 RepID=A0ABT1A9V4_9PSEU|nr:cobalt-precorrin-6A reductase [Pseudonocardia humida]